MCCTCNPTTQSGNPFSTSFANASPLQCGCGCIGQEQTAIGLNRYREHLKAELKHVDSRITHLEGDEQQD